MQDFCIKITDENRSLIKEFLEGIFGNAYHVYSEGVFYGVKERDRLVHMTIPWNPLLTTEQFKEQILNQQIIINHFQIY